MVRKLSIAVTLAMLFSVISVARANQVYLQGELRYSTRNVGGHILPRYIAEDPGVGGKVSMTYTIDTSTSIVAGVNGMYTYFPHPVQDSLEGHSAIFAVVNKKVGLTDIHAGHHYMRVTKMNPSHKSMHETFLQAGINIPNKGNDVQRPYTFVGLLVPETDMANEAAIFCGIGMINGTPKSDRVHLYTDFTLATSLFNFNSERKTIIEERLAIVIQPNQEWPEIELGVNSLQDHFDISVQEINFKSRLWFDITTHF